jgi:hypothetical protein
MLIKNYNQFLLEKMGVPEGIVDSAKKLYNLILSEFEENYDEELYPGRNNIRKLSIDLDLEIKISEMTFNNINFEVTIIFNDKFSDVEAMSWGVLVPPTSRDDHKLHYDVSNVNSINLSTNLLSKEGNTFEDVAKYLKRDKNKTIGIISHELKHVYDKYKIKKELLSDIVDYATWSRTRTGFSPIDDFIYYIYVISKSESLVRPSEIAGQLESSEITKSEFKEFLESTAIYRDISKIKKFTFSGLKSDLLKDISKIRESFDDIPEDETDEDVIDTVLQITYESMVKSSVDIMSDILGISDPIKRLIGIIKQEDIDFANNYFEKLIFKNKEEFFVFWEKKIKFEADKVLKKISKLFDMCKDDSPNQLMDKINQRVNGDCIVNPELYDKFVLKTNEKKYKFKK